MPVGNGLKNVGFKADRDSIIQELAVRRWRFPPLPARVPPGGPSENERSSALRPPTRVHEYVSVITVDHAISRRYKWDTAPLTPP